MNKLDQIFSCNHNFSSNATGIFVYEIAYKNEN